MSTLLSAMLTDDSRTENNAVTSSTTQNFCVDFFFKVGGLRKQSEREIINAFVKAFDENPLTAMKLLFWSRDIRGGSGERFVFRTIVKHLANTRLSVLEKNIHLIPEYGRWDDLLCLIDTPAKESALKLIRVGLYDQKSLCAKWMPRETTDNADKKRYVKEIRNYLGLSQKEYRTLVVEGSKTVEQLMCSKGWGSVEYSKVPSKAMSDYMKAFKRNDTERFTSYLESLKKGETKINASAIYPYDVLKNVMYGDSVGADLQWKALPNYMTNTDERILPMVDVSGSMTSNKVTPAISAFHVAVSLGLYISERNEGKFKDSFITFTSTPTVQVLKGSLTERFRQLKGEVGYNTDIQKAFNAVLDSAIRFSVPQSEMPTKILILSDMEFDSMEVGGLSVSAYNMIKKSYENAKYEMPEIVFWNLASRNQSNFPVRFDQEGVALISGFSPAILKSVLSCKLLTPIGILESTINSERYEPITL